MILLKAAFPQHVVKYHQVVPSTMRSVKEDPYPAIHWAKTQTAGVGQYGRQWASEVGGLYVSLRDRVQIEQHQLSSLAQMAAIAVTETLRAYRCSVKIKWPNDLFLGAKKLGGILVEIESLGGNEYIYTLGLGLNMVTPTGVENAIGLDSCLGCHVKDETILIQCLKRWYEILAIFIQEGADSFDDAWSQFDYLRDKEVKVQEGDEVHVGVGAGINEHGHLILKMSSGEQLSFDHQSFILEIN
jgi:BirA family biotin operon repressor/biotin-[acetyl-CoA-carboxylase] ligase